MPAYIPFTGIQIKFNEDKTMINKLFIVVVGLMLTAMVGCSGDDVETATNKTKEAAHDIATATKDMAHDAAKATEDAAHKAVEATKDASHDAATATKEMAHDAAQATEDTAHDVKKSME